MTEVFLDYLELLQAEKYLEIIERYYDDEIVQVENYEKPIQGKQQLLAQEKNNIERVYSSSTRVVNYVINEKQGLVMGEMQIFFHSKKSGKQKLDEAFIQKWRNNKIVYQRFYYAGFIRVE